jgi:hypothetical protein
MASYWLCPLYNFRSYSNNVKFDEGFRIKSAWPELKEELLTYYPDWPDAQSFDYMVAMPLSERFLLETDLVKQVEEVVKIHKVLFEFITSLRLCHRGVIIPGPLISAQPNVNAILGKYNFDIHGWGNIPTEFGYLYGFIDLATSEVNITFNKPIYELNKSDIPLVNNIGHDIHTSRESKKYHPLHETLRRFNSSYYGSLGNRLIDQMIAFESLYIGDLTYKLALRTAFFLGKKKMRIFKDMKDAYGLRGDIVHGSKRVNTGKLTEIIPKSEEYLRQSLRKFLYLSSRGMELKQIRDKLDENILTNGRTLDKSE